jgi:hypothetical protein
MDKYLRDELICHIPMMFFSLGKTLKDLTDLITETWTTLKELSKSDKAIRYYIDAVNDYEGSSREGISDEKELILGIAVPVYKKFCSFTESDFHLDSMFQFMFDVEYYFKEQGKTLEEAYLDGSFQLPFREDHEFYLDKLMSLNGDPQNLYRKFAYLWAGFHFYENLMTVNPPTDQDLAKILRVDREMGFMREEVATLVAVTTSNIGKLKRVLKNEIVNPINVTEMIDEIKDLMIGYKSTGLVFSSRDEFCNKIESDKKIGSRQYPLKAMTARRIWAYLPMMGITTDKNFQDYYNFLPDI